MSTSSSFLGFTGFQYQDLFDGSRLLELQRWFERELESQNAALSARYKSYLLGEPIKNPEESELLIELAPYVEHFLGDRFRVQTELAAQHALTQRDEVLFRFKREIVTRRIRMTMKKKADELKTQDPAPVLRGLDAVLVALDFGTSQEELAVAKLAVAVWEVALPFQQLKDQPPSAELVAKLSGLRALLQPAAAALTAFGIDFAPAAAPDGQPPEWPIKLLEAVEHAAAFRLYHPAAINKAWISYTAPKEVHFDHLVDFERPRADLPEQMQGHAHHSRERPGFKLTDPGYNRLQVLDQVHYCIFCHPREKDSCSKGFKQKDDTFKPNPLGIALEGCPLEEKISEFQKTRVEGFSLGALAIVTVDNPMCPGTGHRICNDCMKACIYQKQTPVNVPFNETGVLAEVLELPYGVEIYGLLTRWNPLNRRRPVALPHTGKKVMVVGLGPAGYTLAQHLLNEGFGVVAIDGLKLEPLPKEWLDGPIRDFSTLTTPLDERVVSGFGGVSEYGITVRWDKNYLTLMYLTLARRHHFMALGGVRFGGTLTLDDAWQMGFDHVAIASGAGRPTIIDIKNNLLPGIRKASDFLMALQLSGAFKSDALANLQVRLPGVVIGGGLTGIDTATEMLAYYVVQVDRTLLRHEQLLKTRSEADVLEAMTEPERETYVEFLTHGKILRAEREAAAKEGREAKLVPLLQKFGGVSLVYRKTMKDSPAYRLNHEEVEKCLEEGVWFTECLDPKEAIPDASGWVSALRFERVKVIDGKFVNSGEMVQLPARTVCVAAGTSPNTMYEKEYAGSFALDPKRGYFKPHSATVQGRQASLTEDRNGFFTSYLKDNHTVSFYGDNHPVYAGSVVKAMASAKDGYPHVAALYAEEVRMQRTEDQPQREAAWQKFKAECSDALSATVVKVERLTDTIVEVIVRAPLAAQKFKPGQFYRLQNFERLAPRVNGVPLLMEGLALTGAWTDKDKGLLSMIVLEMGGSSNLCIELKEGEPVVVMGPTGAPTEIPHNETVALVGGGLGNAVLFSIARALKNNGCKVIYFAGYRHSADLFKQEEIEHSTDVVVWASDQGDAITPRRPQDRHFRGNIVQAMLAYASGALGEITIPLMEAERYIVIGSDRMMAAVAKARKEVLRPHCRENHVAVGSINSPMQCMMKEICAQCLQRHTDPATGVSTYVFSCFNQDQELDTMDWQNLNDRLRQNAALEKVGKLYLADLLNNYRTQSSC